MLIAESLGRSGRVLNIDMDAATLSQGERLTLAFDISCRTGPSRTAFLRADAGQLPRAAVAEQDVVWLAALVGIEANVKLAV